MRPKLLILDGSAMISTAYYAVLPNEVKFAKTEEEKEKYFHKILHAPDGTYTNAIYGMVRQMNGLIDGWHPDYLAVAFDKTRNTFRRGMFAQYKAQREATPLPLKQQFVTMQNLLRDAGIPVLLSDTYEADDLAGTLANIHKSDMTVRIVTKDKDYLQLVDDACDVRIWFLPTPKDLEEKGSMFDLYRGKDFITDMCPWLKNYLEYTEAAVIADQGVTPAQIPDLKGIEGDSSDHYPGVRNVSSAAVPLLKEYGSIEGIYAAIDACRGDSKEEKTLSAFWKDSLDIKRSPLNALKAGRADAALCKDLATIRLYCFSEDLLTGKEYRTCKIAEFNKKLLNLGIQSAFLPEF